MQLSDYSVKLLENFVTINTGILINKTPDDSETTQVSTIMPSGVVFAQGVIPEKFPHTVVLYDLKAFLSTLSGFKDANLEVNDTYLNIVKDKSKAKIIYANPNAIVHPVKKFTAPEYVATFDISKEQLAELLNFSAILSLPNIRFFSKEGTLFVQAFDKKAPDSCSRYDISIGTTDKDFDIHIKREYLKMLPGEYTVSVMNVLAEFRNKTNPELYYIVGVDQE